MTDELMGRLLDEREVLTREIKTIYEKLDSKFHLHGAELPIEFDFSEDSLGAYIHDNDGERFRFSLLFVAYGLPKPLIKEDREDLFLHEYAHYMQYTMAIPKEYTFSPGKHGSAWKYCCSLVGAVPSEHYRAGESLKKQDYEKHLSDPWKQPAHRDVSRYRAEKEYKNRENSRVQFKVGDQVEHPKFGSGTVEAVEPQNGSVRLRVRFGEELKTMDQKWLVMQRYK